MKSIKFLNELQNRDGLNDTDLAKKLGISQPSISNIKAGRRIMDDETCLSLALELGVNPMEIIGAACIDRAEKTGQKSLWEVFMTRTQTAKTAGVSALLALVFVINLLTPTEAKAAPVMKIASNGIYIMSNYMRRFILKLLAKISATMRTVPTQFTTFTTTT